MSEPQRTIVYFHYRREQQALTPTTGGLRDARLPEQDLPLGHSWVDELDDNEVRLSLAVAGFAIRPMEAAMEHISVHRETWEQQARDALAEHLPDYELREPDGEEAPE